MIQIHEFSRMAHCPSCQIDTASVGLISFVLDLLPPCLPSVQSYPGRRRFQARNMVCWQARTVLLRHTAGSPGNGVAHSRGIVTSMLSLSGMLLPCSIVFSMVLSVTSSAVTRYSGTCFSAIVSAFSSTIACCSIVRPPLSEPRAE